MKAVIADIYVAPDRARRDMGDLRDLQLSIQEIGLLHPVVVTHDNETGFAYRLIAGQRRLAACQKLGLDEVPITVVSDLTEYTKLIAERDENTCRKPLTPSEMVGLAREIERLEKPKALERKAAGGRGGLEDVGPGPHLENGRAGDIVATAVGTSRRTLERAREVVEAAEDDSDPERQARAREALVEMDATGAIKPAWAKVHVGELRCSVCQQWKAPDEYAGGGPESRGGKTWECRTCASERHRTITTPRRRGDLDNPTPSPPEHNLNDPRVRRKHERMEQVRKLWDQGFKYTEIADKLGVHRTTIQSDVAQLGLVGQRANGATQSVIDTIDKVTVTLADVAGVLLDHKRRPLVDTDGIEIDEAMAREWENRLSLVGSTARFIREIAKGTRDD
jgi:ParB-like chromosome segregation protein Spo0J